MEGWIQSVHLLSLLSLLAPFTRMPALPENRWFCRYVLLKFTRSSRIASYPSLSLVFLSLPTYLPTHLPTYTVLISFLFFS